MEAFLVSDKNEFGFVLIESDENTAKISIGDDWTFSIDLNSFIISSDDEFLQSFVVAVNSHHFTTITQLLSCCTSEYGVLMGIDEKDDTPLYTEGQEIFLNENDNFDVKFQDRVRMSQDDFNSDLFINVFEFLGPQDCAKLARVSKLWNQLTSTDSLWKYHCEKRNYLYDEKFNDGKPWKTQFLFWMRWTPRWVKEKTWDRATIERDGKLITFPFSNSGSKAYTTPSLHCTIKILQLDSFLFGVMAPEEGEHIEPMYLDSYNGFDKGLFLFWQTGSWMVFNKSLQANGQANYPTNPLIGSPPKLQIGSIMGLYINPKKKTLGWHIDGFDYGTVYTFPNNLDPENVPTPCLIMNVTGGASFEIVETPRQYVHFFNEK